MMTRPRHDDVHDQTGQSRQRLIPPPPAQVEIGDQQHGAAVRCKRARQAQAQGLLTDPEEISALVHGRQGGREQHQPGPATLFPGQQQARRQAAQAQPAAHLPACDEGTEGALLLPALLPDPGPAQQIRLHDATALKQASRRRFRQPLAPGPEQLLDGRRDLTEPGKGHGVRQRLDASGQTLQLLCQTPPAVPQVHCQLPQGRAIEDRREHLPRPLLQIVDLIHQDPGPSILRFQQTTLPGKGIVAVIHVRNDQVGEAGRVALQGNWTQSMGGRDFQTALSIDHGRGAIRRRQQQFLQGRSPAIVVAAGIRAGLTAAGRRGQRAELVTGHEIHHLQSGPGLLQLRHRCAGTATPWSPGRQIEDALHVGSGQPAQGRKQDGQGLASTGGGLSQQRPPLAQTAPDLSRQPSLSRAELPGRKGQPRKGGITRDPAPGQPCQPLTIPPAGVGEERSQLIPLPAPLDVVGDGTVRVQIAHPGGQLRSARIPLLQIQGRVQSCLGVMLTATEGAQGIEVATVGLDFLDGRHRAAKIHGIRTAADLELHTLPLPRPLETHFAAIRACLLSLPPLLLLQALARGHRRCLTAPEIAPSMHEGSEVAHRYPKNHGRRCGDVPCSNPSCVRSSILPYQRCDCVRRHHAHCTASTLPGSSAACSSPSQRRCSGRSWSPGPFTSMKS